MKYIIAILLANIAINSYSMDLLANNHKSINCCPTCETINIIK